MKHSILTRIISVFLLASCALAQTKPAQTTKASFAQNPAPALEQRLPELMQKADIPGVSIGLVRGGKVAWVGPFGTRKASTHDMPVTADTVFEAASLSKTVFAYAVMKLVDEGKLNLDTPLSKYLDKPYITDKRIDQITARYVLSHRTGFPNWRPDRGELEIKVAPGERFSYSGEGFVYLAKVVEQITGTPFEKFMEQTVFLPLGMISSSYVWRSDFEMRVAAGHSSSMRTRDIRKEQQPNAAASLLTTAADYAKFITAVVNGTGLQPKTWHEMLTPQVAVDPECTNCTDRTPSAQLSKEVFWGLGWGIERTKNGDAIWHWGDDGAFRCFVMAYPSRKDGVVMFTNSENGLLIAPDVMKIALGGNHPALSWLKYGTYDAPSFRFGKALQTRKADKVMAEFRKDAPEIGESRINSAGYALLGQKRIAEAIQIFQWNVELHPDSSNVYDSLGEAYMNTGNKELAIKNYEKSLELDPKNSNAVEMLKKLRQ